MLTDCEVMINQANGYFEQSDYMNSAILFEELMELAIKNNQYEDLLYFAYRSLISWQFMKRVDRVVKIYHKLAIFSLKHSTDSAIELSRESIDHREKVEILNLIQLNLKYIDINKRKEVLLELLDNYDLLISLSSDYIKTKDYIEKAIKIAQQLDDNNKLRNYNLKLAHLYHEEGNYQLLHAEFDSIDIANRLYQKSLELYRELNKKKECKRLEKKIEKITSEKI